MLSLYFSPEVNNVIRSGKGISHKPHLDRNLYNKHMEARNTIINSMPQSFHQYIDAFIDSVSFHSTLQIDTNYFFIY